MKFKEALKIQEALCRLTDKMAEKKLVNIPGGKLFKDGKGIAISQQDYDTLFPFLFANVEKEYKVGEVIMETGDRICYGATITENEVFLHFPDPDKQIIEYIDAYVSLVKMARGFLAGTNYKRQPISELYIYAKGTPNESLGSNRSK